MVDYILLLKKLKRDSVGLRKEQSVRFGRKPC